MNAVFWVQAMKPREDRTGVWERLRGIVIERFGKAFCTDTIDRWGVAQLSVVVRRIEQRSGFGGDVSKRR